MGEFRHFIAAGNSSRASREARRDRVLEDPSLLHEVFALAIDTQNEDYHKACQILELVAEADLELLYPFLGPFCRGLPVWNHPSAERAASKISALLANAHLRARLVGRNLLNPEQFQAMVENGFDRLTSSESLVAAKAPLIRALFDLGRFEDWIRPELKEILLRDFATQTPAYQSAAREVLSRYPS